MSELFGKHQALGYIVYIITPFNPRDVPIPQGLLSKPPLFSLGRNSHNIKLALKVNSSVAFSTFAVLCNHHFYLVSKHFHPLQRKPHSRSEVMPQPCLHPVPGNLWIYNVYGFTCSGYLTRKDCIICGLLCPPLFIQHDGFEVHLCCCMAQCFVPFYG